MKKLITGLALLAGVIHVNAQTYISTNMQVYATMTNSVGPAYTGTNLVDATRYGEVSFEWKFQGTAASTSTNLVAFQVSRDGTNWSTTPWDVWSEAANGTTAVIAVKKFTLGPIPFIRPMYITNSGSVNMTNASLWATLKGYRRD